MARQDEYRRSGVDYEVLDEVKREAIALASSTAALLGVSGAVEAPSARLSLDSQTDTSSRCSAENEVW
jgi:hypothetical protein